jgi:hypothetical protein
MGDDMVMDEDIRSGRPVDDGWPVMDNFEA